MFGIFRCFYECIDKRIGVKSDMDYKKMIITLLDKVKTENTLKRVYRLLEYLYLREK